MYICSLSSGDGSSTKYEENDGNNQENAKCNFSNTYCRTCQAPKSEHACDEREHETGNSKS